MTEKTQGRNLIIYYLGDWKPMQWAKKRGNKALGRGETWHWEEAKHGNALEIWSQYVQRLSDFVKSLSNRYFGIPARKRVTVIDSWENKSTDQGFGSVDRKLMANGTDSAELHVCYSEKVQDMLLERQRLVENDTEAKQRKEEKKILSLYLSVSDFLLAVDWCTQLTLSRMTVLQKSPDDHILAQSGSSVCLPRAREISSWKLKVSYMYLLYPPLFFLSFLILLIAFSNWPVLGKARAASCHLCLTLGLAFAITSGLITFHVLC